MASSETQKAVRLHAPRIVKLDDVPIPEIEHPDDAIVKVLLAGLCGSDLHPYRGHKSVIDPPFIMGHELYGEIVSLGSSFTSQGTASRPKGYGTYHVGMKVIAAFSVSCMECDYCAQGFTSRCSHSQLLGSPSLPGAQAQFIRVPKAGGTLIAIDPTILPPESAILLADILPTGYFAALQAFRHPNLASSLGGGKGFADPAFAEETSVLASNKTTVLKFAVIGLGPVGVCALVALIDFMLLHLDNLQSGANQLRKVAFEIVAIDLQEPRRENARKIVDKIGDPRVLKAGSSNINQDANVEQSAPEIRVELISPSEATPGSCHAIIEAVGANPTLLLSSELARSFAIISSVGVHSNPTFPIATPLLYDRNLSFAFGRCPVRALLGESKELLIRRQGAFEGFVGKAVPISEASQSYEKFEKNEGGKVCFDPWK